MLVPHGFSPYLSVLDGVQQKEHGMKRFFLTLFLGVLTLVLLALAGLGVLLATFNPNDYKDNIATLFANRTGMQLIFDGDLQTTVFPTLGLKTGRMRVVDETIYGSAPFMQVDHATFQVALLPLIRGRLDVENILLDGMSVKLVTTARGERNWQRSQAQAERAEQRRNEGIEALAPPVEPEVQVTSPREKPLHFSVESVHVTDLRVRYQDLGLGSSYLADIVSFKLENVHLGSDAVLHFNGLVADEVAKKEVSLSMDAMLQISQGGSVDMRVDNFLIGVGGMPGATAKPPVAIAGKMRLSYAGGEQSLTLSDVVGTLQDAPFTGAAKVLFTGNSDLPAGISHDVQATFAFDAIDVDALVAATSRPAGAPGAGSASGPQTEGTPAPKNKANPLAAFATVNSRVDVSIATLRAKNIPMSAVQVQAASQKGECTLDFRLNMFSGTATGKVQAKAKSQPLQARVVKNFSGIQAGPLLHALTGAQKLTGILGGTADVTVQGASWEEMAPTLAGRAQVALTGGQVQGVRLLPQSLAGVNPLSDTFAVERLGGSMRFTRGVGTSNDIALASPALQATATAIVDVPRSTVSGTANLRVAGAPPTVPLVYSGPFEAIAYRVDMEQLARNLAQGVLSSPGAVGREAGNLLRGVGDALRR